MGRDAACDNKRGWLSRVSVFALRTVRRLIDACRRPRGATGPGRGRDIPTCASSFRSCAYTLAMRSGRCAHLPRHGTPTYPEACGTEPERWLRGFGVRAHCPLLGALIFEKQRRPRETAPETDTRRW